MKEYNGQRVYEPSEFDRLEELSVGDLLTGEIVNDGINSLPPAMMRSNCTQFGEASSYRIDDKTGKARPVYSTFRCVKSGSTGSTWDSDAIWRYCGSCFFGESVQRGTPIPYVGESNDEMR